MLDVLIYGIDSLLGSYCAGHWLQRADSRVWYLGTTLHHDAIVDLGSYTFSQLAGCTIVEARARVGGRLCRVEDANLSLEGAPIQEAWYVAGAGGNPKHVTGYERFVTLCSSRGPQQVNFVFFDSKCSDLRPAQEGPEPTIGMEVAFTNGLLFSAPGIKGRTFRLPLIGGGGHPIVDRGNGVLSTFLAALHSIKAEIEERSPQYFDFHALRCLAPADGAVNMLAAGVAAEILLRIAGNEATARASYSVLSPQYTPFANLCEHIGAAYGLGLLPVEDPAELNAVDRAFLERSGDLRDFLVTRPDFADVEPYCAAGVLPQAGVFDDDAQVEMLESIRSSQDDVRATREQRTARLSLDLETKAIARNGSELVYFAGGTGGSTIVVLNALGQGIEFWSRLIDRLMETYRVLVWAPRGTVAPAPPFGLAEQVDDLDSVLQNEGVESCHLIGWCTGPKVAVDFYMRRPSSVRSMAFLNGTFKCEGSPGELDTPYEQNLEFLCRRLTRKPSMAASVMRTFQLSAAVISEDGAPDESSLNVLTMANPRVKSWALAPFRTEETTLNYAHQLVDFWRNDVRPKAPEVHVPVLLMSTEYDEIATAANSRMAAGLFPNARHVHVPAATHYCLYDQPDFVSSLLHAFFENPGSAPASERSEECVELQPEAAQP